MEPATLFTKPNAIVLTHLGLGDNITAIPIIRYLRTRYVNIKVITKQRNAANVAELYAEDSHITIIPYPYHTESLFGMINIFTQYLDDHDIITAGCWRKGYHPWTYLPFNFYDDIGIPYTVFWEYFSVNNPPSSTELHARLAHDCSSYAFVHNTSSTGPVFDTESVCHSLGIDKESTVIINPATNAYPVGHRYYSIAEQFVNKPFIHYVETIKNADYVVMSDSSFFCLAMQLPLKTDKCYLYGRGSNAYSHIWTPKYGYTGERLQKKFISIT